MKNPLYRLNIRTRMLAILVTFMIPIFTLGFDVNSKLQEQIDTSIGETKGVQVVSPLIRLLNLFSDHQMSLIQKQAGDTNQDKNIAETGDEIDKKLAELSTMEAAFGADIDLTPEGLKKHGRPESLTITNLKKKWEAIKTSSTYSAPAYKAIMDDIAAMVTHTADASGLVLDNDLDVYYTAITFNQFPALINTLTELQQQGFLVLKANANKFDAKAQNDLDNMAVNVESQYLPQIHNDLSTALHEDANFNGISETFQANVPPKLTLFDENGKKVVETVHNISNKGYEMKPDDYVDMIDLLHNSSMELSQTVLAEAKKMIEIRLVDLRHARLRIIGGAASIVLLAFALFFVIANSISRPIKNMTDTMKQLADGNTAIPVPSTENKDEVGAMARTVLVFKENMIQTEHLREEQERLKADSEREKKQTLSKMANDFESSVKTVVTEVSASADQMRGNAERLNKLADETKSTSGQVSTSATAAAQTATQVAAAAEELTAAIAEISSQVQKSSSVANQASQQAENINQSMHLLVDKSNRVGEVIQFITNIASQINLLALNATIESARAGEAGRGFAVVASEVKNLANQTAKATEEIVQQVQSMQDATKDAVHSVGSIISIISEISASTAGVAAAVEEQSAATNEISRNITHTAAGTSEISRSIVSVEKGADETGVSSRQVLDSAKALSSQSVALSDKVDEFLRTVRAM